MNPGIEELPSCPIPISEYPEVTMAHGGGGTLMHDLINRMMLSVFTAPGLLTRHDGAILAPPAGRLAFTTDSHVITPIFFPGGDIGALSIYGTVNDLAMCGAEPLWLSAGFILEEGFPMKDLWHVVSSMADAADMAGVSIVTGDTKVVDRGKGDGIYINTAGIGVVPEGVDIGPHRIAPGDAVILSGDIGRHGISIMAVREGMDLRVPVESDLAPLHHLSKALLGNGLDVHCMRDLTRGGLASGLNEMASASDTSIHIVEDLVPVREDVTGACELLGFDPLYVANEGRFALVLPEEQADTALEVLRERECEEACRIGEVRPLDIAPVIMRSAIGSERIVDMLSGEQLPRIC